MLCFNDTATTEIYTLSLHDALPIYSSRSRRPLSNAATDGAGPAPLRRPGLRARHTNTEEHRRMPKLRLAIVGAGPAGIYAADILLKQEHGFDVSIDLFEQLPAPYGLVRYGVAP